MSIWDALFCGGAGDVSQQWANLWLHSCTSSSQGCEHLCRRGLDLPPQPLQMAQAFAGSGCIMSETAVCARGLGLMLSLVPTVQGPRTGPPGSSQLVGGGKQAA